MYINAAILTYLTNRQNKALTEFKSEQPVFNRLFDALETIDTSQVKQQFYDELVTNCQNHWVKPDGLIRGIFFEYDYIFRQNESAAAYGVIFGDFKAQAEPYDFGNFTEFADQFYALPGVTLSICNPLSALDWQQFKPDVTSSDVYQSPSDFQGYTELIDAYIFTAFICLHHALAGFTQTPTFKSLNRRSPFYFLIDEHDMGDSYPVYVTG